MEQHVYQESRTVVVGTRQIKIGTGQSAIPPPKISVKVKKMVKFALEQATKAQRGSRGIVLLFF